MKIDGGCHCGAIAYEAEVDPRTVSICHCTDCQTLTGTAFRVSVFAPEDKFRLTRGTPKIYVKTAESGNKRAQAFCAECGSPIYATSVGRRAEVLRHPRRHGAPARRTPPKRQSWHRSARAMVSGDGRLATKERD